MNKRTIFAAACCAAIIPAALCGCTSEAEEPNVPSDAAPSATSYTLTDTEKLKALAVGETAVWRDYEVTVATVDRSEGHLVAHVAIKAHTLTQSLDTDCLLYLGLPATSTSFDGTIQVAPGETVSGTFTFDAPYDSPSLFWNDKATEGFWDLTLPAVQPEGGMPSESEEPKRDEPKNEVDEAQKQAIAALEAEMPSLFTNNTLYTFASVDTTTATVAKREDGGYEYTNAVAVTDGYGAPLTTNVRLICEPNGNCISMEVDGLLLF